MGTLLSTIIYEDDHGPFVGPTEGQFCEPFTYNLNSTVTVAECLHIRISNVANYTDPPSAVPTALVIIPASAQSPVSESLQTD